MTNTRQIINNALAIGGFLLAGKGVADVMGNEDFHKNTRARAAIHEKLNNQLADVIGCIQGDLRILGDLCYRSNLGGSVKGEDSRRQVAEELIAQAREERSKFPLSDEGKARDKRGFVEFFSGVALGSVGLARTGRSGANIEVDKGKKFRSRIESRRGGRKEF